VRTVLGFEAGDFASADLHLTSLAGMIVDAVLSPAGVLHMHTRVL